MENIMPVKIHTPLWHPIFCFNGKSKPTDMKLKSTIGGFAGACALTLINEVVARVDKKAPRLDLLGMNAVAKFFKGPNSAPPLVKTLLPMAVVGDLVSNTLYYALADGKSKNNTLLKGALLGLGAGLGAVAFPKPMGLDPTPTNKSPRTQALTVAWYTIGGLVAAAVINAIDQKDPVRSKVEAAKALVA
jgi:hypothetical protein